MCYFYKHISVVLSKYRVIKMEKQNKTKQKNKKHLSVVFQIID